MPRIDEYNEVTSSSSDDYAVLDGRNSGTRKIKPDNFVKNSKSFKDLEEFVGYLNSTKIQTIIDDLVDMNEDISDVKADIGDLEDLETTDKSSLVGAINEARGTGGSGSGLTEDVKQALLDCFENVAWINDDGQTYYDALEDALYPPAELASISAVYTQSGTVYNIDTLNSLKADLVVTAHMSDSTTQTVTTYTLSGTLTEGTSTITVAYGGKTTTFSVVVTSAFVTYIQSDGASYINIGYDPDGNTKIEMDYMSLKDSGSVFQVPIGTTTNNSTTADGKVFNFYISSTNVPCAAVANQKTNALNTDITLSNGSRNVYTLSNADFAIDGISKGVPRTSTGDRSLDTNIGYPFYVFARNQANTNVSSYSTGRIYYLKIYENDTLVKHFKPAFNGTIYGLYEEIGGTFYENSGSGTITGA